MTALMTVCATLLSTCASGTNSREATPHVHAGAETYTSSFESSVRPELASTSDDSRGAPTTSSASSASKIEGPSEKNVMGRLVDHTNAPLADETLWIKHVDDRRHVRFEPDERIYAETRSDADGRFFFDAVPSGDWWVGPAARKIEASSGELERAVAPIPRLVRVPANGNVDVLVRSDRGLTIHGRVVGADGETLAQACVQADLVDGTLHERTYSDADGWFVIGPLLGGDYELTAISNFRELDATTGRYRPPKYPISAPLRAAAGDRAVVLTMRLGGTLRGTTTADLADAIGMIRDAQGRVVTATPIRGTALACPLAPGRYSVFAPTSSGVCAGPVQFEIRLGATTDVVLSVRKGATLVVSIDPSTLDIDMFEIWSSSMCIDAGASTLPGSYVVPPGHVVVRKHSSHGWSEQETDIAAEETRELVLR
jgi:hypothetical protein